VNIIQNPLRDSDSICIKCKYLLKRLIVPLNESDFGIDREELGIPEDDEIILEHYMCTEALLDLDHTVIEFNKFEEKIENSLLKNKF
jgi:hypothetical protein